MLGGLPERLYLSHEKRIIQIVFLITDNVDLVNLNVLLFHHL